MTTALALAVLVQLIPNAFMYGDAPGYTRQMTEGDLWVETIHVGYTLVGYLFTRLVPGDPVYVVNLMSAVFGALCVGLVTSIANKLAGKLSAGIAAALALVCIPEFVLHSVFAELYIVQLAFFLLSALLLLWDRPIASGLAFAWAFLVTPSTVLALPLIVFWRPDGRFLLKWGVSGALLALAALVPNYGDYLWGGRGLANISAADLTTRAAAVKEWREIGGWRSLVIGAFSLVGLVAMTVSAERWRFAAGIAILWPLGFVFGERYQDVPVQLPFYAMLAVAAGVGFAHLMHLSAGHRVVSAAVLLAFLAGVGTSLSAVHPLVVQQSQLAESLREDVRAMSEEVRSEDAAIYVWPAAPIAEYDLVAAPGIWIDYKLLAGFGDEEQQRESWSELETAIADERRIWLLLAPAPAVELLEGRGYRVAHAAGGMVAIAWLGE